MEAETAAPPKKAKPKVIVVAGAAALGESVVVNVNRNCSVMLAAAVLGKSEGALRKLIERGIWIEGKHWHRDEVGSIWVHLPEVNQWIETA